MIPISSGLLAENNFVLGLQLYLSSFLNYSLFLYY